MSLPVSNSELIREIDSMVNYQIVVSVLQGSNPHTLSYE